MPFFPGNYKLKTKMDTLEERIRNKKVAGVGIKMEAEATESAAPVSAPSAKLMEPLKAHNKASKPYMETTEESEDEEFAPLEPDHDESYASDTSFKYTKAARKPKKLAKKLPVFRDVAGDQHSGTQSPKTAQLLKIINSRDVSQIKTLVGVGAKKADAIVSSLLEMEDEEILDLEGLASLKGLSGKSVETMRMGVWAGF